MLYNKDDKVEYFNLDETAEIIKDIYNLQLYEKQFKDYPGANATGLIDYIEHLKRDIPKKLRDKLPRFLHLDSKSLNELERECLRYIRGE